MNLSTPFISRPIATTLLSLAILLGGILGYRALPVSALPSVDFPTIQVTDAACRAPAPDTIAALVTALVGAAIRANSRRCLDRMTSTSSSFGISIRSRCSS